jgi:Fe-S-cluster containining protein
MLPHVSPTSLAGAEHLSFRCNGCGDCCRTHRVALTHLDLRRLAAAVGEPPEVLLDWLAPEAVDLDAESASFVTLPEGPRLMVLAHADNACRLLDADDRCGAYAARPRDCQLYPFVLERDERREPRRLSLFDPAGCGDVGSVRASLSALERADAERWAELETYRALVARWNRLARHRRRFGHRARTAREFVGFLLDPPKGAA